MDLEGFGRSLDALFSRVPPIKAPSGLSGRVLDAALRRKEASAGRWVLSLALTAACLAVVLAVWRGGASGPSSPVIVSFGVDKSAVRLGEPIVLTWDVRRATKILIQDDRGTTINPGSEKSIKLYAYEPGRYVYTLVAMGPNGNAAGTLAEP
ncbi:MAG TPA: hypothetical protein DCM05_00915 [Elusimicrobia bacterium]|nr:hypothetical protein [Elusimicrobiota bacterium]